MKPRRWYSSPEVNPTPQLPPVCPNVGLLHLRYTSRVRIEQGPVLKQRPGRQLAS